MGSVARHRKREMGGEVVNHDLTFGEAATCDHLSNCRVNPIGSRRLGI